MPSGRYADFTMTFVYLGSHIAPDYASEWKIRHPIQITKTSLVIPDKKIWYAKKCFKPNTKLRLYTLPVFCIVVRHRWA